MRATVLGQTWKPRVASSAESFSVVRRVQRMPEIGSPAASGCRAVSMAAIRSGVFFQGWTAAPGAAHPVALDILGEQLLAAAGHGTGVETEQVSDPAVTAVAELEGLEAGVQAALAFVQQRAEQEESSLQLVRHDAPTCGKGKTGRLGLGYMAGPHLRGPDRAVGREVDQPAGQLGAPDASLVGQVAQRILGLDLQQVVEFVGGVTRYGGADQRHTGVDQGAVLGEPHAVAGPQAEVVELGDLSEGVVLATVGIAGEIGERAQGTEYGQSRLAR